jgi:DNA ligase (NAD+)
MPYVTKPINDINVANDKVSPLEVFPTVCPICGEPIVISDSGKSAKCTNPNCNGRAIGRMVDMCAKLGLVGFGEATIAQMGYLHLAPMMQELTGGDGVLILESRGFGPVESDNIVNQLISLRTNPLYDTILLGSIGFDNVSVKTFEAILPVIRYENMSELLEYPGSLVGVLENIQGIGQVTANIIEEEMIHTFRDDLDWMFINGNIIPWIPPTGKRVVLSGTRDQELVDFLNTHGFVCDPNASLTKSTDILVIPLDGYTSSKVTKAQSYGIPVVTVNDIMTNYVAYQ